MIVYAEREMRVKTSGVLDYEKTKEHRGRRLMNFSYCQRSNGRSNCGLQVRLMDLYRADRKERRYYIVPSLHPNLIRQLDFSLKVHVICSLKFILHNQVAAPPERARRD
jgi:hypothetical protein